METSLEGSSSVAFGCFPLSVAVACFPSFFRNIPPLLPLLPVLPPASGSKIFPGCTSIAPYPHAAGAELASGELRLGFQPSLQEAGAHFLGQAAHMASLLLAAPSPAPAGSVPPLHYTRLMSFFLTLGDVPGPSEKSLSARGVLAKCVQLVEYDILCGPGSLN